MWRHALATMAILLLTAAIYGGWQWRAAAQFDAFYEGLAAQGRPTELEQIQTGVGLTRSAEADALMFELRTLSETAPDTYRLSWEEIPCGFDYFPPYWPAWHELQAVASAHPKSQRIETIVSELLDMQAVGEPVHLPTDRKVEDLLWLPRVINNRLIDAAMLAATKQDSKLALDKLEQAWKAADWTADLHETEVFTPLNVALSLRAEVAMAAMRIHPTLNARDPDVRLRFNDFINLLIDESDMSRHIHQAIDDRLVFARVDVAALDDGTPTLAHGVAKSNVLDWYAPLHELRASPIGDMPVAAILQSLPTDEVHLPPRQVQDKVHDIFDRSVIGPVTNVSRTKLQRRAAAIALAVHLYRVDHDDAMPEALDALVPEYLPAVPRDPMAPDGRPLGYIVCLWPDGSPRGLVTSLGDDGEPDLASWLRPGEEPNVWPDGEPWQPRYDRGVHSLDNAYMERSSRETDDELRDITLMPEAVYRQLNEAGKQRNGPLDEGLFRESVRPGGG